MADAWLCDECVVKLTIYRSIGCPWCHAVGDSGVTCVQCASERSYPDALSVAYDYGDEVVAHIVQDCKYRMYRGLGSVMGERIAIECASLLEASVSEGVQPQVIPIPLHRDRERERGFNQTAVIAKTLARRCGWQYDGRALFRQRATVAQAQLSREQRQENMGADVFAIRPSVSLVGESVILVDDVCTTGATLAAAASVLRATGAREVVAVAFARNAGFVVETI